MPKEQILELLKDKPDLQKEIESIYDSASAKDTVQKNNTDLTEQRKKWESDEKELKAKIAELSKPPVGGETPEMRAVKEELTELKKQFATSESDKQKAIAETRKTELKSSIVAAAGKAISPNQVLALMQTEGLVGTKDDGTHYYHKLNAEGQPVSVKPDEAVNAFLASNKHLEKSSGNGGSGQDTQTQGAGGGEFDPMKHL